MSTVTDYIPGDAEIGVGLAILNDQGEYVFFLAGTRHMLEPTELFYAGIGGHLDPGETLLECGRREAFEEIGAGVDYISHTRETLYIASDKSSRVIVVSDEVKPLAVFEMIHPKGSPKCGNIYHIVIYLARLQTEPEHLKLDEVSGLITLSTSQVKDGVHRKVPIQQYIDEGSRLIWAGDQYVNNAARLYPIGTAEALAYILDKSEKHVQWHGDAEVEEHKLDYSVIIAKYNGQYILIRNRNQTTWELPGGKREEGETILQSARRELYEETGAVEFDISPIGVYSLNDSLGMAYYAEVLELGDLPDYEIGELQLVDALPDGLNYGNVYYVLHDKWMEMTGSNLEVDQIGGGSGIRA